MAFLQRFLIFVAFLLSLGPRRRGNRGPPVPGRTLCAFARREIAGWGKQGRKLVGEVVVADALAPEAARRAQR